MKKGEWGYISRAQRKRVKERDGNRCVACWRIYRLTIHHHYDFTGSLSNGKFIGNNPYGDSRDCDLVTLCANCHGKIQVCKKGSPFYRMITEYLAQFNPMYYLLWNGFLMYL